MRTVSIKSQLLTPETGALLDALMVRYNLAADEVLKAALEAVTCYSVGIVLPRLDLSPRERVLRLITAYDWMQSDDSDAQKRWRETVGLS
jgi:hypothetical protein